MLRRKLGTVLLALMLPVALSTALLAQDPRSNLKVQSSPFKAPDTSDSVFVVDDGPFLDTGCLFSGSGPLEIELEVGRAIIGQGSGLDVEDLIANGVIAANAELILPAFDVDYSASSPDFNPERDRISFNGTTLNPPFLTGSNGVWKLNSFSIPTELVMFPADPGPSGTLSPAINQITINIDTANSDEVWCTAVDWVALSIQVARPVAFFHGILSEDEVWDAPWVNSLESDGFLTDRTDLGRLDSIQANAQKIAQVVERMRTRWGVDRINIVAHSKGGLDSRHYIENRDSVERLIQFGTPNAGAPLANYAQVGSAIVLGVPETIAIDLALPAGWQLTTWHMDSYNQFHPLNPQVEYTALAGDYTATIFDPINLLIGSLTPGSDDLVVPVASVHALSIGDERTHSSSGNDESAIHWRQNSSSEIFNVLRGTATQFGKDLEAGPVEPMVPRTGTQGALIQQGQTLAFTTQIEETQNLVFSLTYGQGDLDLAVITPDGTRLDAGSSVAGTTHGALEDFDGFKMEAVSLEEAISGIYTMEVSAVSTEAPGGEPFLVSAWLTTSDLVLDASGTETSVPADEPLALQAQLAEGGLGLGGATVNADIRRPDGSLLSVPLADDGGGSYSAVIPAPLGPGVYRTRIVASGLASDSTPFSREDNVIVTVGNTASTISSPHDDRGEDTNANGLFDELVIEVALAISDPADYRLVGVLSNNDGSAVIATAAATANLSAGSQNLMLNFDGRQIFDSQIDGPYQLQLARLAEETADGELLPIDERTDVHTTQSYSYTDFEHDPVELTGNASLTAIDDDANGLFDRLLASFEVQVFESGSSEWSGRLLDPDDSEVQFSDNGGVLATGINTITLEFDGCRVRASAADGSFQVGDLLLFGGAGSLVEPGVVAEATFDANSFQCEDSDLADTGVEVVSIGSPNGSGTSIGLQITNYGPSPATGLVVQALLDGPAEFSDISSNGGFCDASPSAAFCSVDSLPSGAITEVALLVNSTGSGAAQLQASTVAVEVDLDQSNNVATAQVALGAGVDIPTADSRGLILLTLLLALAGLVAIGRLR